MPYMLHFIGNLTHSSPTLAIIHSVALLLLLLLWTVPVPVPVSVRVAVAVVVSGQARDETAYATCWRQQQPTPLWQFKQILNTVSI